MIYFVLFCTYFYLVSLVCFMIGPTTTCLAWQAGALFLLTLEIGSPGMFFCISFSLSASFVSIFSLYCLSPIIQVFVFLGSSAIFFMLLQRYVQCVQKGKITTNVSALIGQIALVTRDIVPPMLGEVKIKGQLWQAQAIRAQKIDKNSVVYVHAVRGTRLLVDLTTKEKN